MSVTDFARQVLEMEDELKYLRHECAQLKAHNAELLGHIVESNRASERQLHGWITGIMDGTLRVAGPSP